MIESFDLISDFHVEMNTRFAWDKNEGVLVIAGDTANSPENELSVLRAAADAYDRVIAVDGNHTHYSTYRYHENVDGTIKMMKKNVPDNVSYCPPYPIVIDGTAFVATNGWYDWNAVDEHDVDREQLSWKRWSNDSRMIDFNGSDPLERARDAAQRIAANVELLQDDPSVDSIVVVTHTVPRIELMVPKDHEWAVLNGSYHNSLMWPAASEADAARKIRAWCFGHTHFFYDTVIDGVRFVSNPRGYHGELRDGTTFTGIKRIALRGSRD